MSFKHGKFSDSAVLRSLEKIAFEKGLVKEEKITKSAEQLVAERDLSSSNNLSQDIIKLCAGLRRSGLHKHADDVERNYVNYKRAQTLYEVSKEKGEDLVDFAHPEGGHVFEDVGGKPKVMTILERQEAMKKVVNKEPSGKLSVAQAIRAVKNIFATDVDKRKMSLKEYQSSLMAEIIKNVNSAYSQWTSLSNYVRASLTGSNDHGVADEAMSTVKASPTMANLVDARVQVNDAKEEARPSSFFLGGLSAEDFASVKPKYESIVGLLNIAIDKRSKYNSALTEEDVPDDALINIPMTPQEKSRKEREQRTGERKKEQVKSKEEAEKERIEKIYEGQHELARINELEVGGEFHDEEWAPALLEKKKTSLYKETTKASLKKRFTDSNGMVKYKEVSRALKAAKSWEGITEPEKKNPSPNYKTWTQRRLSYLDNTLIKGLDGLKSKYESKLNEEFAEFDNTESDELGSKEIEINTTINTINKQFFEEVGKYQAALDGAKAKWTEENATVKEVAAK